MHTGMVKSQPKLDIMISMISIGHHVSPIYV